MRRLFAIFGLTALLLVFALPGSAQEPDSPLVGGRFYTQASGQPGLGFAVVDDASAAIYSAYVGYGGPEALGYPISRRFNSGGAITQVFQRATLQALSGGVRPLSVMDLLSTAGLDNWLAQNYSIPPVDPTIDPDAALAESPSHGAAYGWLGADFNGRVTSRVQDFSTVRTLRTQRSAIYESLADGSLFYAPAGEIARDAGIFPAAAFRAQTRAQAAAGEPAGGPGSPPAVGASDLPPPLYLAVVPAVKSPVSGELTKLTVRVTDLNGQPVAGAKVLVIVHYPLKPGDEEAYTVDGVFFGPETDSRGTSVVDVTIDPAVPAGVTCQFDVSAVYPPMVGKVTLDFTVG
ncbi:MAG: hypothetical protein U0556_05720 [Dehalococcoidia bacterium]